MREELEKTTPLEEVKRDPHLGDSMSNITFMWPVIMKKIAVEERKPFTSSLNTASVQKPAVEKGWGRVE